MFISISNSRGDTVSVVLSLLVSDLVIIIIKRLCVPSHYDLIINVI